MMRGAIVNKQSQFLTAGISYLSPILLFHHPNPMSTVRNKPNFRDGTRPHRRGTGAKCAKQTQFAQERCERQA
jgi:hypothetical protein